MGYITIALPLMLQVECTGRSSTLPLAELCECRQSDISQLAFFVRGQVTDGTVGVPANVWVNNEQIAETDAQGNFDERVAKPRSLRIVYR